MPSLRNRFFKPRRIAILIIILAIAIVRLDLGSRKEPGQIFLKGQFLITHVIDGDTIVLDNGEKVRLIGVDAPEITHENIPAQRFGEEAKNFLRKLAEGAKCTLEYEKNNIRDQ